MTDSLVSLKTEKFDIPNIYDLWRAAEIIHGDQRFDLLKGDGDGALVYDNPNSTWPAKGMRFDIKEVPSAMALYWTAGGSSHKTFIYFDAPLPEAPTVDLVLSVLKVIYNNYSLICAEISGMLRLITPAILSNKDYGHFNAVMGYGISTILTGNSPTGDSIAMIRDCYLKLISDITPGTETVNPLFKQLFSEVELVGKILDSVVIGWRYARTATGIRIKTPTGKLNEINFRYLMHLAAKDPMLCTDLSIAFKRI